MTAARGSAASFKALDAGSYDPVGEPFDRYSRICSVPFAEQVVRRANLRPGQQVLDIGTGTGLVALLAAPSVGTQGRILGIDLSQGMLAVAQARAADSGERNRVEFARMDAELLALADASFDAALSLFALAHFPNPLRALREMFRVLRRGGRLVVATGSGVPFLSVAGAFHALRRASEVLKRWFGRRLEAPGLLNTLVEQALPASIEEETDWSRRSGRRAGSVQRLVRQAGFKVDQSLWQRHLVEFPGPESFWEAQVVFSSLARKRLAVAPEAMARVRQQFFRRCETVLARGGRLVYPVGAIVVTAHKSSDGRC